MNSKEQDLLDSGLWKRDMLAFHILERDDTAPRGVRSLTYDMGTNFTQELISVINACFLEINRRFPNIKIFTTGTGLIQNDDKEGEIGKDKEA